MTFPDRDCDGDFVVVCAEFAHPEHPFIWRIEDCSANEDGNTQCIDGKCGVSSCDEATTADSCDSDDSYQVCSEGVLTMRSCDQFSECVEHPEDDQVSCEFDVPCDGQDGCDGSTVVWCNEEGWKYEEIDCSKMGYECIETIEGSESWLDCGIPAESAECDGGDSHCDGSVIKQCLYGLLVEIDCSVLSGGTCADIDGSDGWNSGLGCVLQD